MDGDFSKNSSRNSLTANTTNSELRGMPFTIKALNGKVQPQFFTCVRLTLDDGTYQWFLIEELPERNTLQNFNPSPGEERIFVFDKVSNGDSAFDALGRKGFKFERTRDFGNLRGLEIEFGQTLDDLEFRFLAYVAFTFAASQLGPETLLQPVFDEIRDYIRYGVGKNSFVTPRPPMAPYWNNNGVVVGHLLGLTGGAKGQYKVGMTLFGQFHVQVALNSIPPSEDAGAPDFAIGCDLMGRRLTQMQIVKGTVHVGRTIVAGEEIVVAGTSDSFGHTIALQYASKAVAHDDTNAHIENVELSHIFTNTKIVQVSPTLLFWMPEITWERPKSPAIE